MSENLQEQILGAPDTQFLDNTEQYTRNRILQEQANISNIDAFVPRGLTEWTIVLMVVLFGVLFWWERKKLYKELWPKEVKKK